MLRAIVFIRTLRFFARIGMTFCGSMAGFTLENFESGVGVLRRAVTCGVARQTARVRGFIFYDQCIVGPDAVGFCPVLVLAKIPTLGYLFSEEGKKAVQELIRVAREAMTPSGNLTHQELSELAEQLNKLVNNCLEAPPPPDSWSITLSHKLMPPMDPPLPFIEQSISCLKAYRDDAHLASWCSSGLSASAMESLTLIWRGQVYTFQELLAKLYFRGHPDVVYLDAIAELRANGYLTGSRNNIKITTEGIKFRDQVEQKTEEYFFRPWDRLSESERRQIAGILEQI